MTQRITEKILRGSVESLNLVSGQPVEPYTIGEDGNYHANIGNYHLDQAYGGSQLAQMVNDGGGITTISCGGYVTKRELYNQIQALIKYAYTTK